MLWPLHRGYTVSEDRLMSPKARLTVSHQWDTAPVNDRMIKIGHEWPKELINDG